MFLGTPTATAILIRASQITAKKAGVEHPRAVIASMSLCSIWNVLPIRSRIPSTIFICEDGRGEGEISMAVSDYATYAAILGRVRTSRFRVLPSSSKDSPLLPL